MLALVWVIFFLFCSLPAFVHKYFCANINVDTLWYSYNSDITISIGVNREKEKKVRVRAEPLHFCGFSNSIQIVQLSSRLCIRLSSRVSHSLNCNSCVETVLGPFLPSREVRELSLVSRPTLNPIQLLLCQLAHQ